MNWDDDNANGIPDLKETGVYETDMINLYVTGAGITPDSGLREARFYFDPYFFRAWRDLDRTQPIVPLLSDSPATVLLQGQNLFIESIRPAIASPEQQVTTIRMYTENGAYDEVSIFPVYARFTGGQYSATNANPLPPFPQVHFAQATYATPLAFTVEGTPPSLSQGVSIDSIRSYMFEANLDNQSFSRLNGETNGGYSTTSRYVEGVNGDSATRRNGQSFSYTTFVPSSFFQFFELGTSRDWSSRAYYAVQPEFRYSVYPSIVVSTDTDPNANQLINFYDRRVDAMDLHYSATTPPAKTLPIASNSTVKYYEDFVGPWEPATQDRLARFFTTSTGEGAVSGGAGFEPGNARRAYVRSEIADASNDFPPRLHGRVLATRNFSGKVYVSYGGRLIPNVLGSSERAMDLRVDVGTVNFQMFPGAKIQLALSTTTGTNRGIVSLGAGSILANGVSGVAGLISTHPWAPVVGGSATLTAAVLDAVQASLPTPTNDYWAASVGYTTENGRLKGMTDNSYEQQQGFGITTIVPLELNSLGLAGDAPSVPVGDAVIRIATLNSHVDGSERVGTDGSASAAATVTLEAVNIQDFLSFQVKAYATKTF